MFRARTAARQDAIEDGWNCQRKSRKLRLDERTAAKQLLIVYDQFAVLDGDAFDAGGQAEFFVIFGR